MANRPKKRIDYAGWSVDIFSNDAKIDMLLDRCGWKGFGTYFFLCQMAFGGEGYYYDWSDTLCASTARKMGGGIKAATVKDAVDFCLHIGLFNQELYDKWNILTSRGIQKSYLVVLKNKNRTGTVVYKEYWLLDNKNEDYQGVVFVSKNSERLGENSNSLGVNSDSLGVNINSLAQEYSKVKYSKENKKTIGRFTPPSVQEVREYCRSRNNGINAEEFVSFYESKGWMIGKNRMKDWKAAVRTWEQKRKSVPSGKVNAFNGFRQHDYDFDELEQDLLRRNEHGAAGNE